MSKTTTHTKTPMTNTETPTNAFDIVIVDTVGPLPKTEYGNEYIDTLICDLTKYLVHIPVANKSENTVEKAIFENCILKYGPMKKFISGIYIKLRLKILHPPHTTRL